MFEPASHAIAWCSKPDRIGDERRPVGRHFDPGVGTHRSVIQAKGPGRSIAIQDAMNQDVPSDQHAEAFAGEISRDDADSEIFHLAGLRTDEDAHVEFISIYVTGRSVDQAPPGLDQAQLAHDVGIDRAGLGPCVDQSPHGDRGSRRQPGSFQPGDVLAGLHQGDIEERHFGLDPAVDRPHQIIREK